jgi:hypothetical protein
MPRLASRPYEADAALKDMQAINHCLQGPCPRTGLTRPRGRGGASAGASASAGKGFVPPFVAKALDANGQGGGGGGGQGGEEGPLSARTLQMLGGEGQAGWDGGWHREERCKRRATLGGRAAGTVVPSCTLIMTDKDHKPCSAPLPFLIALLLQLRMGSCRQSCRSVTPS